MVDAMWGNGAGWFTRLLEGGSTKVIEVHNVRNPSFPEMFRPEPIPPNVDAGLQATLDTLNFSTKIIPIYWEFSVLIIQKDPFFLLNKNPVWRILLPIQGFIDHIPTLDGDIVFAGIPAHHYCDIFFHSVVGEIGMAL